jgi:hypothetical protein
MVLKVTVPLLSVSWMPRQNVSPTVFAPGWV